MKTAALLGTTGLAGCAGLGCGKGEKDKLTLKKRESGPPSESNALVVEYGEIPQNLQSVVKEAVGADGYAVCHQFEEGKQSKIEKLAQYLNERIEQAEEQRGQQLEAVFIRYENSIYGVRLTLTDRVVFHSVPDQSSSS